MAALEELPALAGRWQCRRSVEFAGTGRQMAALGDPRHQPVGGSAGASELGAALEVVKEDNRWRRGRYQGVMGSSLTIEAVGSYRSAEGATLWRMRSY